MPKKKPEPLPDKKSLLAEWGDYFSEIAPPKRFRKLSLTGEKVIVASDWHIPLHDGRIANSVLRLAKKTKTDTLIVPGDLFNADSLSMFDNKQEDADLESELTQIKEMVYAILKNFDRLVVSWGNHDNRLLRALGYKTGLRRLFLMAGVDERFLDEEVLVTDWDHLFWRKEWMLVHPKNYRNIPGRLGQELSAIHHKHLLVAHLHHFSLTTARCGCHICIDTGGLFDPRRTDYLQRTTSFPKPVPGFVYLEGDTPHLYSPALGNLP